MNLTTVKCYVHLHFVAFYIAGGMAFFHGYEYLEKNKIEVSEFPAKYLEESQHRVIICDRFWFCWLT